MFTFSSSQLIKSNRKTTKIKRSILKLDDRDISYYFIFFNFNVWGRIITFLLIRKVHIKAFDNVALVNITPVLVFNPRELAYGFWVYLYYRL